MKRAILGIVLLLFCIKFVTNVENHGPYEELANSAGRKLADNLDKKLSRNFYDKNEMEAKRRCEEFTVFKYCIAHVTGSNIECLGFLNESYNNLYDMIKPGCGISKEISNFNSTNLSLSRLATTIGPIYLSSPINPRDNLKENFLKEFNYVLEQAAGYYYLDVNKLNCFESPVKQVTDCMDEYYSIAQDHLHSNLKKIRVPPQIKLRTPTELSKLKLISQFNYKSPVNNVYKATSSGEAIEVTSKTVLSKKSATKHYAEGENNQLIEDDNEVISPDNIESKNDPFYQDDFWNFTTIDKALLTETSTEGTMLEEANKVNPMQKTAEVFSKKSSEREEHSESFNPALNFPPVEFRQSFKKCITPKNWHLKKRSNGGFNVYNIPCGPNVENDPDKKETQKVNYTTQISAYFFYTMENTQEFSIPRVREVNITFHEKEISSLKARPGSIAIIALVVFMLILLLLIDTFRQYIYPASYKSSPGETVQFKHILSKTSQDTSLRQADIRNNLMNSQTCAR